ncbi:hypothetical protein [Nostoc sp. 'Peltigera malacea cyanobiont' DB3992]|uniref:hypothetical protein n=1 Tax=Nostoc sp. 'Peltigera malacea cyanobiont' DB3992 TaxID=1206980 RepID=UPI000C049C69|nr:hypothetical protein [Nostoc sp. 'Peltigera malacea cyanobiont' DB3992]PHM10112.1 hypothetical protein CK516_10510 [Nostoc sp. 'Peltigera malacea cyanobiont' DB3992]
MLLKGYFVGGGGKVFQRTNIVFHSPKKQIRVFPALFYHFPSTLMKRKTFETLLLPFKLYYNITTTKIGSFPMAIAISASTSEN